MALCNVTGTLYLPNGQLGKSLTLRFRRSDQSVKAEYLGAVVPHDVYAQSDKSGQVDFDILTGVYVMHVEGGYSVRAIVPDAATANIADCIDAAAIPDQPPVWYQQALDARDDAQDAADRAENAASQATGAVVADYFVATDADRLALSPSEGETAYVSQTGHTWKWQSGAWVDMGVAPFALSSDVADNAAALRDAGALPLTNIGGTGDAITADLLPSMVAAGITSLSTVSEVEYIPAATNDAANPTMTIGGTTFMVRNADGNNWPARAFVVGRSYKLRRRNNILRVVQGGITEAEIDQAGVIRLVNLSGSDAITAEIAPGLEGQSIGNGRLVRFRAAATNAAPGPTMTVSGVTRQIRDTNGAILPAGAILEGRSYIAEIYSGTTMRLVYASNSAADIATQNARLDANDAKWVDRAVHIAAETPEGYTKPASATTIVTRGGDYVDVWQRSGDQSNPPADGRVLTANDGYWIRVARTPKSELVQPVLDAVQQVEAPALRRSTDAQFRVHELMDLGGGLHLPGLRGLSVQDHIQRLYQRLSEGASDQANGLVVNAVSDLGCDPNGMEPCQGIINAAMASLSSATYKGPVTIYYPRGTYRLTDRIMPVNGISHIGAGRDQVTFLPYGIRAAFDRRGTLTWLSNCVFAHFGIDGENQVLNGGSYDVQTKGAFFQGFKECVFTDLRFENTGATSLGIDFADASLIQRILVRNGGRLASYGDPGGSGVGIGTGWIQNEPLIITDIIAEDCTNYGVFLERQRGEDVQYEARGNVISKVLARGNGHGIGECGCYGTIISDSQLLDNVGAGLAMHRGTLSNGPHPGRRTLIRNNVISGNGGAGIERDGTLTFGPYGYSSEGNLIENNAGPGHWIRGGSGGTVDDTTIGNDQIIGNTGQGILIENGDFTNLDIIAPRLINNDGPAIQIDANVTGGRISGATIRDLRGEEATQTESIVGSGNLTDFDISEVHGVGCAPINLTGTQTRVTYGRNPGVS